MAFTAGQKLRASDLNVLSRVAFKTSTQTVNNSTTLVSDTQLFIAVAANTNCIFTSRFLYTSGTTPDIKFGFTYPVGATGSYTLYGIAAGGATLNAFHQVETSVGALEGGTAIACTMTGSWTIGATAGVVQLRWAQNTANASNTQVLAGSFIRLDQVVV
jgi:hypothetical protein